MTSWAKPPLTKFSVAYVANTCETRQLLSTVPATTSAPTYLSTSKFFVLVLVYTIFLSFLAEHFHLTLMAPAIPPSTRATLGKLARRVLVASGPALAQPHLHHFERRGLSVNRTQGITLGLIGAYVVIIALLWNLPYVRWVLWPFKVRRPEAAKPHVISELMNAQMLVIAFHEFGHAITACCTGGRVESISLDPHEGGVTHMRGGKQFITLPAGYLGSSLIGALLTFCGFNIVASKVASIVLGVCFLLTLWWARKDWLTIGTILLAVGLLIAFWFIEHGEALRFMVVLLTSLEFEEHLLTVYSCSLVLCPLYIPSGIYAMT